LNFKRLFQKNSELSTERLQKLKNLYQYLGYCWVGFGLLFVLVLVNVPLTLDTVGRLAAVSCCVGGLAACLAMYAQYRVFEVELSFELRLREEFAKAKALP